MGDVSVQVRSAKDLSARRDAQQEGHPSEPLRMDGSAAFPFRDVSDESWREPAPDHGQPHSHQFSPQMLHGIGAAPGHGSTWWYRVTQPT